MRMSQRATVLFLSVAVPVVAGCWSDPAGIPPGSTEVETPSFNFTNGPLSPGPFIVRIPNAGSRVITTDPARDLLAIHGKVADLTECTDASTRVPVDIQIVQTPSDAQALALLLTGDDNDVAIYQGTDISQLFPFEPANFCPFIADHVPLYTGQVKYQLHINGPGSLHFKWEGFVERVADGARFHYVEHQYTVPRPNGTLQTTEEIRLQAGADF